MAVRSVRVDGGSVMNYIIEVLGLIFLTWLLCVLHGTGRAEWFDYALYGAAFAVVVLSWIVRIVVYRSRVD
jgi:hypothetical protein